jgi:hypothetical protein
MAAMNLSGVASNSLPARRPVFARRKAPVQTDIVTSAVFAALRTHCRVFSLGALWAGMTMTFGAGAVWKSWSGTIFIPPLARIGFVVSATV